MKHTRILATAISIAFLSINSFAQTARPTLEPVQGVYIGGAFGAFGASSEPANITVGPANQSKNANGTKLMAGYQFTDNYGVEVGRLHSGAIKRSFLVGGANLVQSGEVASIYAAATGRLPVSESIALNARLGLAKSKFSGTSVLPAASSIVGGKTGLLIGIGAEYRFTQKIAATLDYDYLPKTSPRLKSGLLSVGVKVGF